MGTLVGGHERPIIRQISSGDPTYRMGSTVNKTVLRYWTLAKRVALKCSHDKKKKWLIM